MKAKTIIVVDDDEDDCELIHSALEQIGVKDEIKFFNDGKEALKYLKETTTETFLIVSDINMAGIDGFTFKKEINEDEKLRKKSIPFVFLTTSSLSREVDLAYDMSAHGYFTKPNTLSGLKDILRTVTQYWGIAKRSHVN